MAKTTFTIREINKCRLQRGEQYHIRVDIYEDDVYIDWLWMTHKNIEQNKEEFGKDSFLNSVNDFK